MINYDKFYEQLKLYGIVFIKYITDKNGNITEEIIDQDKIHLQDYEQLEIIEYFRRKQE